MICVCGYNLLQPTGETDDYITCLRCGWWATGREAEHGATHHYHETKHPWNLAKT